MEINIAWLLPAIVLIVLFAFKALNNSGRLRLGDKKYAVTLYPRVLINNSEKKLFHILKTLIERHKIDAYIFSQVSYGELIGCRGIDSFAARGTFNSRRADFVIVDFNFNTLAVVEYHGEGHFKGADMSKSDSIKEAACGAAGINFITVHYREKNNLSEYLQENLLPVLKNQEDKTISSTAS